MERLKESLEFLGHMTKRDAEAYVRIAADVYLTQRLAEYGKSICDKEKDDA